MLSSQPYVASPSAPKDSSFKAYKRAVPRRKTLSHPILPCTLPRDPLCMGTFCNIRTTILGLCAVNVATAQRDTRAM